MTKPRKFCPYCGGRLKPGFRDGRERLFCEECGSIIYENPLPATAAVTVVDSKIALVKRNVQPALGEWSLPGGFVEMDESPAQCALRELEEETGLSGEIIAQLGAESQPSRMYVNVLVCGYLIRAGGNPVAGDDAAEVKLFDPEELPRLPFESHRAILKRGMEIIRSQ